MSKAIKVRRMHHQRGGPYLIASCEPHKLNRCHVPWDDRFIDNVNYVDAAHALIHKIEKRAGYPCGFHGKWTMGWLDHGVVIFTQEDGPSFVHWKRTKEEILNAPLA